MTDFIKSQGRRPRRRPSRTLQLLADEAPAASPPADLQPGALDRPAPEAGAPPSRRSAVRNEAMPRRAEGER